MSDDVETLSVPLATAKAGIQLKPGHPTIIIEDGKGDAGPGDRSGRA